MEATARRAGDQRGSSGVVTAWSQTCAWVWVFPAADDGLAYTLLVWSAMAGVTESGGKQRDRKEGSPWVLWKRG